MHRCEHGHWVGESGSIYFEPGLIGEIQAKMLVDALCEDGCPRCHRRMVRESDFKAYCSSCKAGIELVPPTAIAV